MSFFFTGMHIYETEDLVTMDTELGNPSSSGSVLENFQGDCPKLKERKISLNNGKAPIKLFTSIYKQKFHAQSLMRSATFISIEGYSGLENQIYLAW